jgi:hypothetical protein
LNGSRKKRTRFEPGSLSWSARVSHTDNEAAAHAAAGAFSAAMAPMGCLIGAVIVLFWLTMFGLVLVCAWIWSLPSPK